MEQQPFYIGQEVVALRSANVDLCSITKGHKYIIMSLRFCCRWHVDIGHLQYVGSMCEFCGDTNIDKKFWYNANNFAPIERTRIKYVEKQVEVAPAIKELEKCLS